MVSFCKFGLIIKDVIMLRSITKKNVVFYLFVNLFISLFSNAQTNIIGTWKIDKIVGVGDYNEYSLVSQKEFSWGNNLKMELDGTFVSRYLAGCGNDCFTSSSGRFIIIDDAHIRFILVNIDYSGWCGKELKSETDLNRDLGIFYVYKDSKSIRLIKSNGNLQDDKDKMLYTEMLKTFDKNWKAYEYSWVNTNVNIPEEVVKDYLGNKLIGLSDYKIVYSKKEGYGELFLVRKDEDFHYVLYNGIKQKVSLAYPR